MLQFDRLKISTSLTHISLTDNNRFKNNFDNEGVLEYTTYSAKIPSLLKVILKHHKNTVTMEFTGKILGDEYGKLLSCDTIQMALKQVEIRTGCTINIPAVLDDAKVMLADVTKDIPVTMSSDLKEALYMTVSDVKKWRPEIRKNNGIDVKKAVTNDSKCRERIILYCKSTEVNLARNKPFIASLENPDALKRYFAGKTRVEYNLSTVHMLKKTLEIEDNSLFAVLHSKANPLFKAFHKIFDSEATSGPTSFKGYAAFDMLGDYYKNLLLKEFNDDVRKAELVYRHFYSPRSNFRTKRRDLVRIRNLRKEREHDGSMCKESLLGEIAQALNARIITK